ncbi:hypothetical protein Tco_0201803 [Tanacetum coccineum]
MYVDHMSQPWRTLAAIINKCLFGKTASNDRLRKSIIDIMWDMFYRENVDYPELIWEDFAFQIDHRKERISRRTNMSFPRFTKVIINHFLKQHNSLSNLKYQHYHTIKDDVIVSRLKFVRIGEDYQEYGLAIPDMMLNDVIEQSESYQMFLKYSTGQLPPKKKSEPEPVKKKTISRRVVKKKVIIFTADNIIPDPDVALELGKSISLTEDAEEEAARQVHATHARIVTESVPKPARRRPFDPSQKLKGSSKGTGTIPGVPDGSTVVSATSSEGAGTKPGVLDEEKVISEEKVILECRSEQESEYSEEDQRNDKEKNDKDGDANDEGDDHISDIQDIDDEDAKTESDEDEIYKYKICVRKDVDVVMTNAEVEGSGKGDAEISDVAKEDVEKTEEVKNDAKKAELPPTSSSLSVSSGFGDQFLKLC